MRNSLLAAVALALMGCDGKVEHKLTLAAMEHGVKPGTVMPSTAVRCLEGAPRQVGAAGKLQIVTFATPYDCSSCTPHMAGVPRVLRRMNSTHDAFTVVWAPNPKVAERSLGRAKSALPVCMNDDGSLWDRHDILHTPFTVVLDDGRVVYSNDATFTNPRSERAFEA
ncbi:MAG TPA: hypothetical protein VE913_00380, partial [Longimicrobium sp.]|nr:hypothetical protein [Longimicrobium sp.]